MPGFDRTAYSEFCFPGYDLDLGSGAITFRYRLCGSGDDIDFDETWILPLGDRTPATDSAIRELVRLLYLASGLSYFKAAAPPVITITGEWTTAEVGFLSVLVENGLAEFAFTNDLHVPLRPTIRTDGIADARDRITLPASTHVLTPVGGGKDSCVALDAIQARGIPQTLFCVGTFAPIFAVAERAGLPLVRATRVVSPTIIRLNEAGALNGHVPITAVNSLAALITAVSRGASAVFMSNERSASEPMLMSGGFPVNHQWSKGLQFERLLGTTIAESIDGLTYASLLRPYSEYRIAQRFAELRQYHDVFVSCGRAFRISENTRTRWCGECDKCRFVALILSPFLTREEVLTMMGVDVFEHGTFEQFALLLAVGGARPFDCVGEPDETSLAVRNAGPSWAAVPTFAALRESISDWRPSPERVAEILQPSDEHCLPPDLAKVLDDAS